ncbi:MAG: response regulator [Alphaproteobacteria bacterium]|nr:MAG: response regulator [Alphaproteobacteria bacterium]
MQQLKPILLIEDDSVDAMTVKRAMKDLKVGHDIVHSINGEEALKYLTNPQAEKPFLILLDLNMPKMSGIEFLKIMKKNPAIKTIPVIVLTTSKEKHDVFESFELGASGYMVKPVDYSKFVDILRKVMVYWSSSQLPNNEVIFTTPDPKIKCTF